MLLSLLLSLLLRGHLSGQGEYVGSNGVARGKITVLGIQICAVSASLLNASQIFMSGSFTAPYSERESWPSARRFNGNAAL